MHDKFLISVLTYQPFERKIWFRNNLSQLHLSVFLVNIGCAKICGFSICECLAMATCTYCLLQDLKLLSYTNLNLNFAKTSTTEVIVTVRWEWVLQLPKHTHTQTSTTGTPSIKYYKETGKKKRHRFQEQPIDIELALKGGPPKKVFIPSCWQAEQWLEARTWPCLGQKKSPHGRTRVPIE
jgi:hypothetical protein